MRTLRQSPIVSSSYGKVQQSNNEYEFCRPERFPLYFPCSEAFGDKWVSCYLPSSTSTTQNYDGADKYEYYSPITRRYKLEYISLK